MGRRGPLGEDLRLDYDGAGRVVAVVDGLGERTRYRRDALGRAVEVVDPDGASTRFAYDAAGRVVERSDPSGAVRLGYDERGRLAVRTGPGGDEARFEYDAAGDLARARSEGADLGWRRDALGRVVEVVDRVLERSVHYGWAPGGLRTSLATPEVELRYDYDARGRMVAVQGPGGTTRWDLDAAGRRTRVRNPNGVETRYERDLAGRVVEAETVAPSGPLERWAYAYDDAGRVVRVEGPEGEARLAYDEAGRLAREERDGAVARRYGYDAAGNRLEAAGEVTYVHDEAGRVVERQGPEGATRFAWDVHGRLVGAEAPDGRVERYGYAPDGRRLWRERDGRRVRYLHDGENLLAEYAQDGSCLATYVHGDGLDDVLGVLRAGQRWACHTDGRTNLTALTDGEGAVAARYRYDAFGVPLVEEEPFELPYRYASASWDGLAGVYPMRARPYDPRAGRFLSKDPLGQAGGLNLYAYVGNDPAGRVDPWGLSGEESVWGRIGGWFEGAGRWTAGAARDTWAVAREVPGVVWEDVASGGARDRIYAFGRGLGYGVVDAGKGLGQMVLHPVDTLSGLKDAVVNWDQTAAAVGRLVDDYWEAARSDPERFAEMTGRLTAEIELAIVGAKGLDKLAKARQIQRLRGVVAARSAAVARTAGRAARGSSVGRVLAPVARRVGAAATVTGAALGGAARAVGSGLSSAGGAVRQGMSRAGATARAAAERARERLAVLRGRRPPRRGVKDALDDMAGGKKGGGGPAAGEASGLTAAQARAISREFQEALGRHLRPGVALTDEVFDAAFDDMARVAARHGIEMTMSRDVARSAIRKAFLGDASRALADGQVMDALNSYLAAAAAPPALWPESATRLSMMLRKTNPLIADPMKVLGHEFTHAAHASMARAIARRMGMGADETARFLREFEKTNLTTFERAASRMGALAKNGGDAGAYARELASFTDEMTEALIAGRNLEYSAGLVHDLKAIVGTHTGTILLGAGAYAYWQSTR
ncbi:MAG: RHS repeat-associated core domain-containing protein [Planctomycetes bacterium]|nr:RHS repeat-associated core domain-containing protein [Planctomycetota bacterium]